MVDFSDEYFINLTMDYDHRDDEIYPKWAVWCAKSDDRYVIDGKEHHFYTRVRTDEEISIERKKREIMESMFRQREEISSKDEELFREYELYLQDGIFRNENVLDFIPKSFVEWKESKK